MKHTAILSVMLAACGEPVECNNCRFLPAEIIEETQGACLWATGLDGAVTSGECPADRGGCAIVTAEEPAVLWTDGDLGAHALIVAYALEPSGACSVSCDWDGPTVPAGGGIDVPCPPGITIYPNTIDIGIACPEE